MLYFLTVSLTTHLLYFLTVTLTALLFSVFRAVRQEMLFQYFHPLHPQHLKQSHGLSASAPGAEIPCIFSEHKLHRLHLPAAHGSILSIIIKLHDLMIEDGLSELSEQLPAPAAPVRKIYGHPILRIYLKELAQFLQCLRFVHDPNLCKARQARQYLNLLFPAHQHFIEHKLLGKTDAAVFAFCGINRDSRHGQRLHIPVNGTRGHFKSLGQLSRSDGSPIHQYIDNCQQTVQHLSISFHITAAL